MCMYMFMSTCMCTCMCMSTYMYMYIFKVKVAICRVGVLQFGGGDRHSDTLAEASRLVLCKIWNEVGPWNNLHLTLMGFKRIIFKNIFQRVLVIQSAILGKDQSPTVLCNPRSVVDIFVFSGELGPAAGVEERWGAPHMRVLDLGPIRV